MDDVLDATTANMQNLKTQSLITLIIEHGCPVLEKLQELRVKGWEDPQLKAELDRKSETRRKKTDESTVKDDQKWFKVNRRIMNDIDEATGCIREPDCIQFLDLGCCPGGFSQYVLDKCPEARGVGISLEKENGGFSLRIPDSETRYKIYWGDLTFYDICAPISPPCPEGHSLSRIPFTPNGFKLAILDGHHKRGQESESTKEWDIPRLLVAQVIIGLQSLDTSGTMIISLKRVEHVNTARILYMLDTLSQRTVTFKPWGSNSLFYAVATGIGLGLEGHKLPVYLERLKELWWQLTYGGDEGEGRWLVESDLNFIVDNDTLAKTYLDRLIELGKGPWRVQRAALKRNFDGIKERNMLSSTI